MSKQRCRSNRQQSCLLLRQCCRFGQQCRSNVRLCRKDEISTQNSFDIVAVFGNGNNVEATFDIVAFDNVASTLLLVWTGLKSEVCRRLDFKESILFVLVHVRSAKISYLLTCIQSQSGCQSHLLAISSHR